MANLEKENTNLKDCYIIHPKRFGDERGYYESFFVSDDLKELGITNRIEQAAESKSVKGTVRGLHFQKDPYAQAKLVRCVQGGVLDVVVDLRKDSPTYKQWTSVELTPENGNMLYVPRGFAHGFVSLQDDSKFQYLVDSKYMPSMEDGILWKDPEVNINWQFEKYGIVEPIISGKDQVRHTLEENAPDYYMHKRYLVTGFKGQLGYDVVREFNKRGIYDILALDVDEMDITDRNIVNKIIGEYRPECVIHCAAYTAVDKAEECSEIARKINVEGTKNIADACKEIGSKMVYISTDYVFDGTLAAGGTYKVTDMPNPKNVYGVTKYEGELAALENPKTYVIRTAWVFGINGNNFIKTMLNLSENHSELTVVNDQIGTPTYTVDLAKFIVDMINTEYYGIHHFTNDGYCSWAEFASYILKDTNTVVKGVTTDDYYAPKYADAKEKGEKLYVAYRPKYSVLDKSLNQEQGFDLPQTWQQATDAYIEELKYQKKLKK